MVKRNLIISIGAGLVTSWLVSTELNGLTALNGVLVCLYNIAYLSLNKLNEARIGRTQINLPSGKKVVFSIIFDLSISLFIFFAGLILSSSNIVIHQSVFAFSISFYLIRNLRGPSPGGRLSHVYVETINRKYSSGLKIISNCFFGIIPFLPIADRIGKVEAPSVVSSVLIYFIFFAMIDHIVLLLSGRRLTDRLFGIKYVSYI